MVSHGYEHGFRTLGRQVLLEPIAWTDDGWPVAAGGRHRAPQPSPADAAPQLASQGFDDDFASVRLGERWTFHAPTAGEAGRLRVDDGLVMRAKGSGPADTSPLCIPTGDHSYEVEVDVEVSLDSGTAEGGLLLFFNNRLFCGMGIDGERMLSYSGGIRTHWREPALPRVACAPDPQRRAHRHRLVPPAGGRVGAAPRAVRDIRVPREHRGRPAEPPSRALRRRGRRGAVPGFPVPVAA